MGRYAGDRSSGVDKPFRRNAIWPARTAKEAGISSGYEMSWDKLLSGSQTGDQGPLLAIREIASVPSTPPTTRPTTASTDAAL
jgi:hypothetical protein